MYLQKSHLSTFSLYLSATMPLGPLIFGSDGNIVQFLSDKHLSSDRHCPKCFEEMRIDSLLFCLFVFICANINFGGRILQMGKNPLVKNTPSSAILLVTGWPKDLTQYRFYELLSRNWLYQKVVLIILKVVYDVKSKGL